MDERGASLIRLKLIGDLENRGTVRLTLLCTQWKKVCKAEDSTGKTVPL